MRRLLGFSLGLSAALIAGVLLLVQFSRGQAAVVATRPTRVKPTGTSTPTPFQPVTSTPTYLPTAMPTATASPTPQPPTPTSPPPTPTLPPAAMISEIRGRYQAFTLDCESRSAVDWAAYFGLTIDEVEFLNALPRSDNPEVGFVGDVNAPWGQIPPNPYGVHARPVARLLRAYGAKADAVYGMSWDALRAEIAAGHPVIVWVIGRVGRGTPIPYTASDGGRTIVARFEHTVIVIGYDKTSVTVLDGAGVYARSINDFLDSWGVLGNMAIVYRP